MPDLADQLESLAARVGHLAPSHRDPERFFEERDEIRGEMVRMARAQQPIQMA